MRMGIERATVLGAGVMGSQIAALLAHAGIEVDLLDLADGDDSAGRSRDAIERLQQLRPPPLFVPEVADQITPGGLDDPAAALARADWVIEAVVEDLDVKRALFDRLEPLISSTAWVTTNTSGIPIDAIARGRSKDFQKRFFGVHFFNPPRYMKLVEVIPGASSDAPTVDALSSFLTQVLGKGVVRCRDTPNFIANRLGVFAIMDVLQRMVAEGLSVDEVDAVTGPVLGRPRSATLRLCDLIGLDTLAHVAATASGSLRDDPWRHVFVPPAAMQAMIEAGRLGEKTGAGFYRKTASGIEALDLTSLEYRSRAPVACDLPTRGELGPRLAAVMAGRGQDRLSRFACEHLLATLSYCAATASQVAESLEEVDRALRWGFNWEAGPFEQIDLIGARTLVDRLQADGHDPPPLLTHIAAAEGNRVYLEGAPLRVLRPDGDRHEASRPAGPATDAQRLTEAEVVKQCDTARLLHLGEGAAVLEFRGKLNVLGSPSLAFALDVATEELAKGRFRKLVLTGAGDHFTAGADLRYVLGLIDADSWGELEAYLQLFQAATVAMRYASVPVVVAARGLSLGGGCELGLSAAVRVVAGDLRLGLVESKVGVVPGAGGCKEMVRRFGRQIDAFLPTLIEGRMSDNALQARAWGFLESTDPVRLDGDRLLGAALARAEELLAAGWTTPEPQPLEVAGPQALERLQAQFDEQEAEERISSHDGVVGRGLARVVCGGGASGAVPEERLLELEREVFLQLCGTEATRARIAHMLETGKPLRN